MMKKTQDFFKILDITIYFNRYRQIILALRALSHGLSSKILELTLETDKGLNVSDIYLRLNLEQSVASQQLAILRRANLINFERQGKEKFYRPNDFNLLVKEYLLDFVEEVCILTEASDLDDKDTFEHAIQTLKWLSNKKYLMIVEYIAKHPRTPVNAIYRNNNFEQSITSQRLKNLQIVNVIKSIKESKNRFKVADLQKINDINLQVETFIYKQHKLLETHG